MDRRIELQNLLEEIIGNDHVYFQKPENVRMEYPAIKYDISNIRKIHADNIAYLRYKAYSVTVIDYDPDSEISEKISELPLCSFDRAYQANNLNHFVYTLYY